MPTCPTFTEEQREINAHLLVVQPDDNGRAALCREVEALGHAVTTAANRPEALYLLESQVFDLILLAADSPAVGALHLLAALRAVGLAGALPVLVYSESGNTAVIEQCLAQGADDYWLGRPPPALRQRRINLALEKKRLREKTLFQAQAYGAAEKLADDLRFIILPFGIALSAEKSFDRLLEEVVREAQAICCADSGVLFLAQPADCLQFAVVRLGSLNLALGGLTGQEIVYPPLSLGNGRGPASAVATHDPAVHVAVSGQSINISNVYEVSNYDLSGIRRFDTDHGYQAVSLLVVPLKDHANKVIGVLQLMNAQDPDSGEVVAFDAYHQLVVESLASQAAVALHNQILRQRQQTLLKMERDLQIGRQIQASFLPGFLPQPPGWELAGRFQPAREVAGDFYDAFPLTHGRIGFVLADVCGKGVGAALFMALTRSLVRAFVQQDYYLRGHQPPDDSLATSMAGAFDRQADERGRLDNSSRETCLHGLTLINNYIYQNHGQAAIFASLFFGVLDPATAVITYINAGHSPPLVVGSSGVKAHLLPTGPALGLHPDVSYAAPRIALDPGDLLLAFTDGVTDARDPEGRLFNRNQLLALLERPPATANGLLDQIEMSLQRHVRHALPTDDIALLAVRRLPA